MANQALSVEDNLGLAEAAQSAQTSSSRKSTQRFRRAARSFGRWSARLFVALIALLALTFAFGYVATSFGDYPIAATVSTDKTLPQMTINGALLHSEAFGDPSKPTVIVVHGGPGNDYRYLLSLKALADDYYVVFYDQRGSGLSARMSEKDLSLGAHYEDLHAIIERYGKGKPVKLIGHSWGAMLASGYLGRHPERVDRIVLAEPGFLTSREADEYLRRTNNMRPPLSLKSLYVVSRAWFESLHVTDDDDDQASGDYLMARIATADVEGHPLAGYHCDGKPKDAALRSWRFGMLAQKALFKAGMDKQGRFTVDFRTGVHRYKKKVLFVASSCNTIIGADIQRRHMKYFHDAELVVIDGSGHAMFGERPVQSIAAVRKYFSR